jgi:hypothetical protein
MAGIFEAALRNAAGYFLPFANYPALAIRD